MEIHEHPSLQPRDADASGVGESVESQPMLGVEGEELALTPAEGVRDIRSNSSPAGRPARISMLGDVVSIPATWLDQLLALAHEVPLEQGEAALLQVLTVGLERVVPEVRVAIQLRPGVVATDPRRMLWTEPPKSDERPRSARAFPDAAYERSVTLPGAVACGSLHFASDEDVLSSEASPHVQVQDRAAAVVAQVIARGKAEEEAVALRRELRSSDAQMIQVEKLASLGQIAAGMVHELNNPHTSIAAYTDFLLRRAASRPGTEPDDVERLRRIAESATRMLRFTRDLGSYARPSGDVPIAVQLNAVIDRALAFCEHEVAGAGVVVERRFDPQLGPVRGLPEQLAQVFVNLVTNACHALARPTGGDPAEAGRSPVLTISTTSGSGDQRGRVIVVVHDNGRGIAGENLHRLFTPFFTTKPAGRGTGLGLSIVKKIVDGHGGEIRAESDRGSGTSFILAFPVETGGTLPSP